MRELLTKSHELLKTWLNNEAVPIDRKIPVAVEFIKKRIPSKIEGEGFDTIQQFVTIFRNARAEQEQLETDRTNLPPR